MPGHVIRRGHGKFDSQSHKARYQLEHDPKFGFPSLGRLVEVRCWLCPRSLERYESQVAAAKEEKRRFVCPECDQVWRPRLAEARAATRHLDPKAGNLPARSSPELARLFEVAQLFQDQMRVITPKRRGNPRAFLNDLVIEALFLRGYTDEQIDRILLGGIGYTVTRRKNAGIHRRRRQRPQITG